MPLDHVDRPGYETARGVHFPMRHSDRTVRVLVPRAVLQNIQGLSHEGGGCLARFESHRREFEAVASDKFGDGQPKGKIEITSDDMLRFLVEKLNAM
jgi:hypothetical protein